MAISRQRFDRSVQNLAQLGLRIISLKVDFINPRWRTAAILKTNRYITVITAMVRPIAAKFGMG